MRKKTLLSLPSLLVFLIITLSFGAETERNARMVEKINLSPAFIQKNAGQWQTKYDEVIKGLPTREFIPGRILCKPDGIAEIRLRTFDPKMDMAFALDFAKRFLRDTDEHGIMRNMEYCQPDYVYSITDTQITPLDISITNTSQLTASDMADLFEFLPNDPLFTKQAPYLGALGMPKVWDKFGFNYETANLVPIVNVVDTGIYCEDQYNQNDLLIARRHPDIDFNHAVCREDFVSEDKKLHWHASAVTATIAAITNNNHGGSGIAPPFTEVREWRVCDSRGRCSTFSIAAAINQIAAESDGLGNEVINLSLGGPGADPILEMSISFAVSSKQITVVAASGNAGKENIDFPAAFPDVIAAGALTFGESKVRAPYSSYGPELAVVAPVGDINQDADNNDIPDGVVVETFVVNPTQYRFYIVNGTSFAAPQVIGEIAWLISQGVLGPDAIRRRVAETAEDLPPVGFDNETGRGMIRIDNALLGIAPTTPSPPPTPLPLPSPPPLPPPSPVPTADIKANGSDEPVAISYNTAATISWFSANASSCSVSPTGWSGTSNAGISTGNLISSITYTLTCTGNGGSATDSVTINVTSPPPPPTPPLQSGGNDFCQKHPCSKLCRDR